MNTPGRLYALPADSAPLRLLLDSPDPVDFPSASPDGLSFVYHTYTGNQNRLAIARGDGTGSHFLAPICADQPEWSPAGTWIAFTCRDTVTGNADIYLIHPDGSGLVDITNTPDTNEEHPSWSPDGSELVVSVSDPGGGITRLAANGGNRARVTTTATDREPEWGHTGSRIAFVRTLAGGATVVYTVNADGTNEQPLSTMIHQDYSPTWSPTDQQIAFVRQTSTFDLYIINADGTAEHRSTFGFAVGNPRWMR